jgi:hypothetical protein
LICHPDHNLTPFLPYASGNDPTLGRKLDGIRQQVDQYLMESVRVSLNVWHLGRNLHLEGMGSSGIGEQGDTRTQDDSKITSVKR